MRSTPIPPPLPHSWGKGAALEDIPPSPAGKQHSQERAVKGKPPLARRCDAPLTARSRLCIENTGDGGYITRASGQSVPKSTPTYFPIREKYTVVDHLAIFCVIAQISVRILVKNFLPPFSLSTQKSRQQEPLRRPFA